MKHTTICMLAVLMSMACTKAFAYDIAVENADGKTIYYNYINNGTELEVTHTGSSYSKYSGNIVIPETVNYMNRSRKVTSIGKEAFYGCSGLTSVTIPNSVTSIGSDAFLYCSGLKKVIVSDIAAWCGISFNSVNSNPLYYAKHLYSDENTEITDLVIPNSVTSIGKEAFYGCSGLTSVTIPNSVTSIGSSAFRGCSGLTSVTIGNSVTSIGDYAFYGCSGLTSVTIGNSVKSIGYYAFYSCSGLTSVAIPNSVTSIGNYAFSYCSGLKKVIVSDIAAWCGISFHSDYSNPLCYAKHLYSDENTEITNLAIPNSVTSIGYSVFYGCSGLTSVTIGNSVTSIGQDAFRGCSGLTSVTIGNSVTSIGYYAFSGCSGLTSVTIPNSVTSIGYDAFSYCSGLTSVTIGSGVTEIGGSAFNSDNLATVISKIETPFAINGKSSSGPVFSTNTFMNADLFVPVGTIDKYKATKGWKDFVWITEGIPSGIEGVKTEVDKTEVLRYTIDGKKLSEPQEGINIIKMSDGTTKKVIVK